MKHHFFSWLFLFFLISHASAQLTPVQQQKIDSLFTKWNIPNHPGGTVGIMQNGKTVFSKAYGLASLEYLVPNTPQTLFNVASVSKQFTAMGIVLLHLQGKVSLDADIRTYLPELPEFEAPVTLRHMLHHTSGLRSIHGLLELAGWRADDARNNKDLFRFMKQQQDLNFKPGSEYLYCNTGYMFMADIIEKVTGEKFAAWMKKSVFEPLGMPSTYVEDKYDRVVPNNATSYYPTREGFDRAVEYWGYVGSGNIHSNTQDLLSWLKNFHDPQPGWEKAFTTLLTLDKLNNGEDNNYAFGLSLSEFNNVRRIDHSGAIGGYRSFACTYPEQQLSIVVLTNFSNANPAQKSDEISNILLPPAKKTASPKVAVKTKKVRLSKKQLKSYEASYWNEEGNYARKIYVKNDTLRYFRTEDSESALIPLGNDEFRMADVPNDVKVSFNTDKNGLKTMMVTIDNGKPILSAVFEPVDPSKADLSDYTGAFYSPELETTYTISAADGKLSAHHARHGDFGMKILKKDVLEGEWPFNLVKFRRDNAGKVSSILVTNGRVRNAWFEKR